MNDSLKKQVPVIAVGALLVAAAFYGGMQVGAARTDGPAEFGGMPPGMERAGMMRGAGGFVAGDILSTDGETITVRLQDGGSKILYWSDATAILTGAEGSSADLVTGARVTVTGTANDDGSVTATSIQVRPADETAGDGTAKQS